MRIIQIPACAVQIFINRRITDHPAVADQPRCHGTDAKPFCNRLKIGAFFISYHFSIFTYACSIVFCPSPSYSTGEAPAPAPVPCSPPPVCPSWQARPSYSPALFCRLPTSISVPVRIRTIFCKKPFPREKKIYLRFVFLHTNFIKRPHCGLFHSCIAAERLKIMLPRRSPAASRILSTSSGIL